MFILSGSNKGNILTSLRAQEARNELVNPHNIDVEEWVSVRHEEPQKFELK